MEYLKFPILIVNAIGVVVIATGIGKRYDELEGTVVESEDRFFGIVGEYRNYWNMSCFSPYDGEVELSDGSIAKNI